MATLPAAEIRRAVRQGLEEDLTQGDATTAAIFSSPVPAHAEIIAQQPLVVAGMAAAVQTFLLVDPSLQLSVSKRDGDRATNGERLLHIEGDGRSILQAERV
ncbi:MAG TPA: nicotinate-nucleotide diphosphorylase (carboxylating), partial [Nitrospira sp.]|nr:nicotinate-nucleotide diphosphorylase (carboxylating) [Nitrospira sp.]